MGGDQSIRRSRTAGLNIVRPGPHPLAVSHPLLPHTPLLTELMLKSGIRSAGIAARVK